MGYSLQSIQYRAIIARRHLDTQGSGNQTQVERAEVWFLIPRCRVQLEQPNHLGLFRDSRSIQCVFRHVVGGKGPVAAGVLKEWEFALC